MSYRAAFWCVCLCGLQLQVVVAKAAAGQSMGAELGADSCSSVTSNDLMPPHSRPGSFVAILEPGMKCATAISMPSSSEHLPVKVMFLLCWHSAAPFPYSLRRDFSTRQAASRRTIANLFHAEQGWKMGDPCSTERVVHRITCFEDGFF